jgi:hypothetical protein
LASDTSMPPNLAHHFQNVASLQVSVTNRLGRGSPSTPIAGKCGNSERLPQTVAA